MTENSSLTTFLECWSMCQCVFSSQRCLHSINKEILSINLHVVFCLLGNHWTYRNCVGVRNVNRNDLCSSGFLHSFRQTLVIFNEQKSCKKTALCGLSHFNSSAFSWIFYAVNILIFAYRDAMIRIWLQRSQDTSMFFNCYGWHQNTE